MAERFTSSFRAHKTIRRTFTSRPLGVVLAHCVGDRGHHVAEVESSEREDVPLGAVLLAVNGKPCADDGSTFEGVLALVEGESLPLVLSFALPSEEIDRMEAGHEGLGKRTKGHDDDRRLSLYATCADRRRRGCTDIFWLGMFTVFWAGMFAFAAVGVREGDPYRLLYGTDHNGEVCGRGAQAGKHELYYPQLQKDLLRAYTVDPSKYNPFEGGDPSLVRFFGVCVNGCPQRGDTVCTSATAPATLASPAADTCFPVPINTTSMLFRCLPFDDVRTTRTITCADPPDAVIEPIKCGSLFACQALLEARLVTSGTDCTRARIVETTTTEKLATINPVFDMLTASGAIVRRWFGDLALSTTPVLLCGGVLSLVLAFFYLFLLEHFAFQLVWGTFIACYAMLLALTYVLCSNSGLFAVTQEQAQSVTARAYEAFGDLEVFAAVAASPSAQSVADAALESEERVYLQHASRLLAVGCVAVLFFMMHLRRRIALAIGILREASKTLQEMPLLIFFPLAPIVAAVALTAYWVVVAAYLQSIGNVNANTPARMDPAAPFANATTPGRVLVTDERVHGALLYHFFGLLWAKQFLHAVCVSVIAGAVSDFYTLREGNRCKLRRWPVWESLKRVCRYHLGSIALGSLILAAVSFLRFAQEYLDRKTKALQAHHSSIKCAMCMLRCFVRCLTSCVGSISQMGFILIAVQGGSFCASCRRAVKLIFNSRNLATIGTTTIISNFVLHLGILIIVMVSTGVTLVLLRQPIDTSKVWLLGDLSGGLAKVSSPLLPLAITMLLSYAVSMYAFSVYQMAIDTIMMCFLLDKEQAKKSGQYFAPDSIRSVQRYLDGPASELKFKHYESKRVGVHWVPKDAADHCEPPAEDDDGARCCWPCESGGTVRSGMVPEAEMTLRDADEGGGGERSNPVHGDSRFPHTSEAATAISLKSAGGAALDSV